MPGFRHIEDTEVAQLARLRVVRGRFEAPDGTTFERDITRHQSVVAMVPLHPDGTVVLVRQYRGPIDSELLEIPAGLCDVEGEDPERTAARELKEEVGLEAGSLQQVAAYYPAAGFADQFVRLYLATDLRSVPDQREGVEEQHMTVETVNVADVDRLIASGDVADSKTIIGLLMARDHHRSSVR